MNDDRQLSGAWQDLQQEDEVPLQGKGTSAERAERDQQRRTPRYPSEDLRVGRKISPTLSRTLIRKLRAICKAEGYIDKDSHGIIASPVIEDLLQAAVEAYERGEFEEVEEVVEVRRRLRRNPPRSHRSWAD